MAAYPPIIYFYGNKDVSPFRENVFSQWYPSVFYDSEGVKYLFAEQYMMSQKALLFDREDLSVQIMATTKPVDMKRLGKQVDLGDYSMWNDYKCEIVIEGNQYKFNQNPELKAILLQTKGYILAEASLTDRCWGIGLNKDNAIAMGILRWRGQNLLGQCLMYVRDTMLV